jgi:hypothetical protein
MVAMARSLTLDLHHSETGHKKEPPFPGGSSDNREASNRVDRSHSVSTKWTAIVIIEKA